MTTKTTSELEREVATLVAHPNRKPIKISQTDVKTMTPAQINRELDKLEPIDSRLGDEMIAAGRGYERPSEYLRMTDPLSMDLRAVSARRMDLRLEIEHRYGPGAPRRLPPGFKRRG